MIIDHEGLEMAAYQCLNCGQIERSDVDCCDNPDLIKINDMPAEIKRLRGALEAATRPVNPFAVEVIPLSDGKNLRYAELYQAGQVAWQLFAEDGAFVRVLNEYEVGFVNAALCAGCEFQATQMPVPHGWWIVQSEPQGMKMWPTSEDALLKKAAQKAVEPDRYAWHEYMDHGNGMGWIERVVDHDPRTPEYAEMYHKVDWADTKQVRNFRALYTTPPEQTV